jgi:hypothetical protein
LLENYLHRPPTSGDFTVTTTTITSKGYTVTLPTGCVAAFLSLSHDDQVELAEELQVFDVTEPETDVISELIEDMCVDLEEQDQALFTSVDYIADLNAELADKRAEITWMCDAANALFAECGTLRADNDNLNDILLQSSRYVGQARELLGKMGIVIETNHEGRPVLVINFLAIDEFRAELNDRAA